jgi:Na+(H+)/acetate symporter ActP
MEKLAIIAAICSIPAVFFILVAKLNGEYKILMNLFLKVPCLIAAVALILMAFVYFGIIHI